MRDLLRVKTLDGCASDQKRRDWLMSHELIAKVRKVLAARDIPIIAAARAEVLNQSAPEGFRPRDALPGAKSVLIFAKPAPLPNYEAAATRNGIYSFYFTTYHAYYRMADEVACHIAGLLDTAGFPSLPIPSYSPLTFNGDHLCGLISLKHAAAEAGLGRIGRNTLLIHPKYGNTLRLGGLLTTMEWPSNGGPEDFEQICPEDCHICEEACPIGALNDSEIDHLRCMAHCVEHTMLPPRWVMKLMRRFCTPRFIDRYALSFGVNYGVHCCECLVKCPYYKRP